MRAILKSTFTQFHQDDVLRLSAALAYYAIVSIGPLLVIVVAIVTALAGLVFGNEPVLHLIHQTLQGIVGARAAQTLDSMLAAQRAGGSVIATIIGFVVPLVVLLFGATGVFGQLRLALNRIWEVSPQPGAGNWAFIRQRFLSLATVLGFGFLLLVSLALSAALTVLTGILDQFLPGGPPLAHVFNFVMSFGVITLLFALIFKFLPDVNIPWSKVWFGAIVTSVLFNVGKFLLAFYVGRQMAGSTYGPAAAFVAVLLWIYYASVILLWGAELTHVYAKQTGSGLVPPK